MDSANGMIPIYLDAPTRWRRGTSSGLPATWCGKALSFWKDTRAHGFAWESGEPVAFRATDATVVWPVWLLASSTLWHRPGGDVPPTHRAPSGMLQDHQGLGARRTISLPPSFFSARRLRAKCDTCPVLPRSMAHSPSPLRFPVRSVHTSTSRPLQLVPSIQSPAQCMSFSTPY